MEDQDLWFLVSPPRAGSTLLSHLIGNHPFVHAPTEPWIMLALHQLGEVKLDHPFGAWHLHTALEATLGQQRDKLLTHFAKEYYQSNLPKDKLVFLDKTPRYYWILDWLYEVFPSAKFLLLTRNPLDVLASHKTTWGMDLNPESLLHSNNTGTIDFLLAPSKIAEFAKKHVESSRVLNVRYEDLVKDPTSELRLIFTTFDLTARAVRAAHSSISSEKLSSDGFGDKKILDTNSVHNSSIGAWRNVLSPEEVTFYRAWFELSQKPPNEKISALIREVRSGLNEKIRTAFRHPTSP